MVKVGSSKKTCFVIGPIGKENTDIRKNADRLFKFIISPTVEKLGYGTPLRADHIPNPGTITSQIIENLIDSDLVIADLTSGNPNVFYELAVRHVTKKHCIHIVKFDEEIPFDTSPNRTIQYNLDLEGVENAKNVLEEQINSLKEGKEESDNPIGIALTMKDLKSSGNSMQIMMADLTEEVRDLKGEMRAFQSFCKENMRDQFDQSQYNKRDLHNIASFLLNPRTSVVSRDPMNSTATDVLDAQYELRSLQEMLISQTIDEKSSIPLRLRINELEHWLKAAKGNLKK